MNKCEDSGSLGVYGMHAASILGKENGFPEFPYDVPIVLEKIEIFAEAEILES